MCEHLRVKRKDGKRKGTKKKAVEFMHGLHKQRAVFRRNVQRDAVAIQFNRVEILLETN